MQIISACLLAATATIETQRGAYTSGDRSAFIGYVDIAQLVDVGDSLYVQSDDLNKMLKLSARSAFGYLVNLTTLTPAAVAHTVTLPTVG